MSKPRVMLTPSKSQSNESLPPIYMCTNTVFYVISFMDAPQLTYGLHSKIPTCGEFSKQFYTESIALVTEMSSFLLVF